MTKVERLCELRTHHNLSLPSAALQFPLAHPAMVSVVPGAVSPTQIDANMNALRADIPAQFWLDPKRKELIHADAPLPF